MSSTCSADELSIPNAVTNEVPEEDKKLSADEVCIFDS